MKLPIKRYIMLLSKYLRPLKFRTALLAVVLLCGIGLQLLDPQILAYFIDTALAGGATMTLLLAGLLFIIVALANQGVMVVQTYLSQYIAWTATNQLRTDLLAHCLSLDMSFHKARTPGEMIERIDGDMEPGTCLYRHRLPHRCLYQSALATHPADSDAVAGYASG